MANIFAAENLQNGQCLLKAKQDPQELRTSFQNLLEKIGHTTTTEEAENLQKFPLKRTVDCYFNQRSLTERQHRTMLREYQSFTKVMQRVKSLDTNLNIRACPGTPRPNSPPLQIPIKPIPKNPIKSEEQMKEKLSDTIRRKAFTAPASIQNSPSIKPKIISALIPERAKKILHPEMFSVKINSHSFPNGNA